MSRKKLFGLVAIAAGLLFAVPSWADVVLLDFNQSSIGPVSSPDGMGRYWNNSPNDATVASSTFVTDAVDSGNNPTTIDFATTADKWAGSNGGGVNSSSIVDWGSNVTRDNWYVGAGITNTADILISGLNPTWTYELMFYGSRDGETSRNMQVTIGATSQVYNSGPEGKTVFSGLTPNGSGEILVEFSLYQPSTSVAAHLSGLQLTGVPEPGSITLLGSALTLLLWPKRRTRE